jgi:hypothetical protein
LSIEKGVTNMKKSDIYRLAQGAVVLNHDLCISDKLNILRELIAQEDLALYVEKKKEKESAE